MAALGIVDDKLIVLPVPFGYAAVFRDIPFPLYLPSTKIALIARTVRYFSDIGLTGIFSLTDMFFLKLKTHGNICRRNCKYHGRKHICHSERLAENKIDTDTENKHRPDEG